MLDEGFDAAAFGWVGGAAAKVVGEAFVEPERDRRFGVERDEDVDHLVEKGVGEGAGGAEDAGGLEVDDASAGGGGDGAGLTGGVAKDRNFGVGAELGALPCPEAGTLFGFGKGEVGKAGEFVIGRGGGGPDFDALGVDHAPGDVLGADAGAEAGEIGRDDLGPEVAGESALFGADLAEADAVAGAAAAEERAFSGFGDFV